MNKYLESKKKYYTFYILENKKTIIATCRFAGRTIRAQAVCHPGDIFDIEIGKKVAMTKCERKCAKIRLSNAINKLARAIADKDDAIERVAKYKTIYEKAIRDYEEIGGN